MFSVALCAWNFEVFVVEGHAYWWGVAAGLDFVFEFLLAFVFAFVLVLVALSLESVDVFLNEGEKR